MAGEAVYDMPAARAASPLPTPDRDLDRTIAHLLRTSEVNAGHLDVHTAAAQAAGDPALLSHHLRHAVVHTGKIASHLVKLRTAVTRRLPAVAGELDDLDRAIPGSRAAAGGAPLAALDMSIAHDLANAQAAAAHVGRHLSQAQAAQAAGNPVSVRFNLEHGAHHVTEISNELGELDADLSRSVPAVARELAALHQVPQPGKPQPGASRSAGPRRGPEPA